MTKTTTTKVLSDDHKAALVAGRTETRIVRDYLTALATHVPKLGKQRTLKSVTTQITHVETRLADPQLDPVDRVLLTQEKLNLEAERATMEETRLEALEDRFIHIAKSFTDRNGLTWDAWRAANVPAPVLRKAGIQPTKRTRNNTQPN